MHARFAVGASALVALVVISNVTVGDSPMGIAVNPDGGVVYVANTRSGSVSVISTRPATTSTT